LFVFF
jgi:hypothetical protein